MGQILRDPTAFQLVYPATGLTFDFDLAANGEVLPNPSHALTPWSTFEGRESGLFPIDGKSIVAERGTIQVEGTYSHIAQAQTIVYLVPGETPHGDSIEVSATLAGRATFRIYNDKGDVAVQVSTSKQIGSSFWMRFVWDSSAPVLNSRYAAVFVDGVEDTAASWSVDPVRPWSPVAVNKIGIRNGYGGTWPLNGSLRKVRISNAPNLRF
jgi:hypothetical protein